MKELLQSLGLNLLLLLKVAVIIGGAFVAERIIRKLLRRFYLKSDQGHEAAARATASCATPRASSWA